MSASAGPTEAGPGGAERPLSKVKLIPMDLTTAAALAAGEMSASFPKLDPETLSLLASVASAMRDLYLRTGATAPWIGYVGTDAGTGQPVGVCSFKDVCRNGAVEIAYFTFPSNEGLGWGGAMAGALAEVAWAEAGLQTLVAHTLPEENTSTRILRRLGFQYAGLVTDPEDGPVWRWTLARPVEPRASCTS